MKVLITDQHRMSLFYSARLWFTIIYTEPNWHWHSYFSALHWNKVVWSASYNWCWWDFNHGKYKKIISWYSGDLNQIVTISLKSKNMIFCPGIKIGCCNMSHLWPFLINRSNFVLSVKIGAGNKDNTLWNVYSVQVRMSLNNVNLLIVLGRFLIFFVGLSVYALFCDSLFMLRMNACTPSILARLLPLKKTALKFDKSDTNRKTNENQVCFIWEIFTTLTDSMCAYGRGSFINLKTSKLQLLWALENKKSCKI